MTYTCALIIMLIACDVHQPSNDQPRCKRTIVEFLEHLEMNEPQGRRCRLYARTVVITGNRLAIAIAPSAYE